MGGKVFIASVLLLLTACGSGSTPDTGESAASSPAVVTGTNSPSAPTTGASPPPEVAPPASPPPEAAPPYTIIGQLSTRYDGAPTYYVLVDRVDLSSDSFKESVKAVARALTQKNGGPDFSTRIFDDNAIGEEAFSDDNNPAVQSPAEVREFSERKGQHLVAIYSGGLETALYPYELDWYPAAFTYTANVGPYVGSEEWSPQA